MVHLPRLMSENNSDDHPTVYIIPLMIVVLILFTIVILIITAILWRPSSSPLTIEKTSNPQINEQKRIIQLLNSSIPIVFQSSLPFWKRFTFSFCTSHSWFNLFFPSSHSPSPFLRIFTLFTKIIMILFLNSLIYEYAEDGYTSCSSSSSSSSSCEHIYSFLNVGQTMCEWNKNEMKCQARDLNANILRLVFISVLLGVIHLPFWLIFEYFTFSRLGDLGSTFQWKQSYSPSLPLITFVPPVGSSVRPSPPSVGHGHGDEEIGFPSPSSTTTTCCYSSNHNNLISLIAI
jgi:hypothetical protein